MKRRSELPLALPALLLAFLLLPSSRPSPPRSGCGRAPVPRPRQAGTPTHFQMIVGAGCVDEAAASAAALPTISSIWCWSGAIRSTRRLRCASSPTARPTAGPASARPSTSTPCRRARTGRAPISKSCSRFYAARLKDFSISDADAERERNVVRQEHDWRVGSKPFVRLARKLDRLLRAGSSLRPMGDRHDRGHRRASRSTTPAPFTAPGTRINNVDFVVMADIEPAALKDIAERALAGLEPRPLPPRAFAKQPAIVNGRTDIVEQDAAIRRPGVYFKKLIRIEEERCPRHRCGAHAGDEFSDQPSARQPL